MSVQTSKINAVRDWPSPTSILSYSFFLVWQTITAGLFKGLPELHHPVLMFCEARSLSGLMLSSMLLLMH